MDCITIKSLQLETQVGVYPEERIAKQPVRVDLALHLDLRPAGVSDRLEDTVDYATLTDRLTVLAAQQSCQLLETLAERIAGICLADPLVQSVDVTVRKKATLPNTDGVSVSICRHTSGHRT